MALPTNQAKGQGCNPVSSNCGVDYKIYSLSDPETDEVRYIGFTGKSIGERLLEHLTGDCRYYKGNWIKELKRKDFDPIATLIEDSLTLSEAKEKEKHYIKMFKSFGARLTNLTNGGDGTPGLKISQETRDRMSQELSGPNNHFFGKTHSKKSIAKMKEKQKGENNGFYKKTHSIESIKKIKEARAKQVIKPGFKHSEETKKIQREKRILYWKNKKITNFTN